MCGLIIQWELWKRAETISHQQDKGDMTGSPHASGDLVLSHIL